VSSLAVANTTGNKDYLILNWHLTAGDPTGVTYTIQVFDEDGRRRWENVTGLVKTEKLAALYAGKAGHTYRFRSLARDRSGAQEIKGDEQSDETVKVGSPPQNIAFGLNPYPLCPNWGGTYTPYVPLSLIRGEYLHMAFGYYYRGKDKKLKRGDVVVEVPDGVTIVGATYQPYFNQEKAEMPCYRCGTIRKGKKKYAVYFIPNSPVVEGRYYGYRHILRVYFAPERGYQGGDRFHWYPIHDGIAGPRTSAEIEVLPELKAVKTPKYFDYHVRQQTEMAGCQDLYMSRGEDSQLIRKRYELKKKTGWVPVVRGTQVCTRRTFWLLDHGFKVVARGGAGLWWLIPGYFARQSREKIAAAYGACEDEMFWINKDGLNPYGVYDEKEKKGEKCRIWCYYCPTYLCRTDTAFYKGWTKSPRTWWKYNRAACRALNLVVEDISDFEIAMRDTIYDWCFCPRCTEAFAKRTKLPLKGLTAATILSDHKEKWRDFRIWQNGQILRTWCHGNKSSSARWIRNVLMVSVQPAPPVGHDNVDLRQVDSFIDAYQDEITCIGTLLHDHIEDFYKYVKKPCTIYPNPCSGLKVVTANDARLGILATATAAGGGFMTDQWFELTGRHITNIVKARNEIATLEEFFYKGKRADQMFRVQVLPVRSSRIECGGKEVLRPKRDTSTNMRGKAHQLDGRYLIDLFNYDKKSALYLRISSDDVPAGNYVLTDPITDTQLQPSERRPTWTAAGIKEGFVYKVPTEDVKFILLETAGGLPKPARRLALNTYAEEYRSAVTVSGGTETRLTQGDVTIDWDDVEKTGRYEVVVATPSQTVWISPAHGSQVWKWQAGAEKRDVLDLYTHYGKGKYGRTLGMDRFAHWGWGQSVMEPYELVSRRVEGGRAIIVLRRECAGLHDPADGTVINKTYIIHSREPVIQVKVEVENRKDTPFTCDFYAPQWPYLGKVDLDKLPFGRRSWQKAAPGKDAPDRSVAGTWCPATSEMLAAKVDPQQLRSWHFGWEFPPVFEWVYEPSELRPGEKWSTQYDLVYLRKCTPEKVSRQVMECLKGISR